MSQIDHPFARAAGAALAFAFLGMLAAPPSTAGPAPAAGPAFAASAPESKGAAASAKQGLQIPAGEFRERIRAVVLMPVMVPPVPGSPGNLRERYDSLLVEQLGAAGIRGITAQAWDIARQAVIDSAGPAVDKKTGKPDLEKARAIVMETRRRISGRFGRFDALLAPTIWRSGEIWSLHVEIRDPEERNLYVGNGEIVRILPRASGKGTPRAPAPLATTPERDAQAVKSALGPLVKALSTTRGGRAEPTR